MPLPGSVALVKLLPLWASIFPSVEWGNSLDHLRLPVRGLSEARGQTHMRRLRNLSCGANTCSLLAQRAALSSRRGALLHGTVVGKNEKCIKVASTGQDCVAGRKPWTLKLGVVCSRPDCHWLVPCLSFPQRKMSRSEAAFGGASSEVCVGWQQEARVTEGARARWEQRCKAPSSRRPLQGLWPAMCFLAALSQLLEYSAPSATRGRAARSGLRQEIPAYTPTPRAGKALPGIWRPGKLWGPPASEAVPSPSRGRPVGRPNQVAVSRPGQPIGKETDPELQCPTDLAGGSL